MEIIVQGTGSELFVPNEVTLSITFYVREAKYENALLSGTEMVESFVNGILLKNDFKKEDLKTRNFTIRKETKYNETTKNYDFNGYSYNQYASLKFDYDKDKLAKLMYEISTLVHPPMYRIDFGVKDKKECKRSVLAKAYKDAEEQAQAIASAAGKTLKQCAKIDFKPFSTDYISSAHMNSDIMYKETASYSKAKAISDTFTPEDIEVTETLYCLWIAE